MSNLVIKQDYVRSLTALNRFLSQNLQNTKIMPSAMRDLFKTTLDSAKMKEKFGKLAKIIEYAVSKRKEESRRAIIAALTVSIILQS